MTELKTCPFCGDAPEVANTDGYDTYGVTVACGNRECHAYVNVWASTEAEAVELWNTRAERTCKNVGSYGVWACSECGSTIRLMCDSYGEPILCVDGVASAPNYCPNCGARVEVER